MVCCAFQILPPLLPRPYPKKHFLCRDIQFKHPGIHLHLKWAKNIQAPEKTHIVKLPIVQDPVLCPVATLQALMNKLVLSPDQPFFVFDHFSLLTQSMLRKRLAMFLRMMHLPLLGYGSTPSEGRTLPLLLMRISLWPVFKCMV